MKLIIHCILLCICGSVSTDKSVLTTTAIYDQLDESTDTSDNVSTIREPV